jgi:hypothetical protein
MTLTQTYRTIAGSFVLTSTVLGMTVDPAFFWLTLFVGANLVQSGFTNWCPMMAILRKAGLQG